MRQKLQEWLDDRFWIGIIAGLIAGVVLFAVLYMALGKEAFQ